MLEAMNDQDDDDPVIFNILPLDDNGRRIKRATSKSASERRLVQVQEELDVVYNIKVAPESRDQISVGQKG